MKRLFSILAIFGLALWAGAAQAQTSCSSTTPCVQLSIANTNSLPVTDVFLSCIGSSCTQAALTTFLSTQTTTNLCPNVQSVWHCTTFSQTKTPQLYNDLEPWGSLMNYSIQAVTSGGVSASAPILIFQVPQQTSQAPSIGTVPIMVTTGATGPQ